MFKILLWKLGMLQKYSIEYNELFTGFNPNKTIDFYYYKNCPKWLLKEAILNWIKDRVMLCHGKIIYIEKINEWVIKEQFVVGCR